MDPCRGDRVRSPESWDKGDNSFRCSLWSKVNYPGKNPGKDHRQRGTTGGKGAALIPKLAPAPTSSTLKRKLPQVRGTIIGRTMIPVVSCEKEGAHYRYRGGGRRKKEKPFARTKKKGGLAQV